MAARAGIGFTALDNGFAACDDVAAVQRICDSFDEQVIEALAASPSFRDKLILRVFPQAGSMLDGVAPMT